MFLPCRRSCTSCSPRLPASDETPPAGPPARSRGRSPRPPPAPRSVRRRSPTQRSPAKTPAVNANDQRQRPATTTSDNENDQRQWQRRRQWWTTHDKVKYSDKRDDGSGEGNDSDRMKRTTEATARATASNSNDGMQNILREDDKGLYAKHVRKSGKGER